MVPPTRALSPRSVMTANPSLAHPYHYKELQELFGMELPMDDRDANDDDDGTINTYERVLKECEQLQPPAVPSASRTTLWFLGNYHRHSEPSLRPLYPGRQTIPRSRQTQSDSALLPAPSGSALRKGRFSESPPLTATPSPKGVVAPLHHERHVRFQARIQVHSYQPPVESWAAEGWSQWFGI